MSTHHSWLPLFRLFQISIIAHIARMPHSRGVSKRPDVCCMTYPSAGVGRAGVHGRVAIRAV